MILLTSRHHPDVPCFNVGQSDSNCIGAEFGVEANDGEWWNPINKPHGTHVFGTIGASGENNEGVQGVIPDGQLWFIIARVFGESGAGSSMSDGMYNVFDACSLNLLLGAITTCDSLCHLTGYHLLLSVVLVFEAVGWVIEQGARIINLSLGGPEQSQAGARMMQTAYEAGVLVVAAAGNTGSSDMHYPASYPHVISVAAVDEDEDIAPFSQFNSAIDIAAPGVSILSTVPPGTGGAVLLSTASVGAPGTYMKYSSESTDTIEGELVDCGSGESICPKGITSQSHVCLIER